MVERERPIAFTISDRGCPSNIYDTILGWIPTFWDVFFQKMSLPHCRGWGTQPLRLTARPNNYGFYYKLTKVWAILQKLRFCYAIGSKNFHN